MKRLLPPSQLLLSMAICAGSLSPEICSATTPDNQGKRDSIIIQKLNNNKKHSVNLYSNASQQVLFFTVSGEEGSIYHLLLFREHGKLIKQSKIRNRETTVVSRPEKGNYYFEVFSDDIRIESGTIIVQ
jgi:hypothetical protein